MSSARSIAGAMTASTASGSPCVSGPARAAASIAMCCSDRGLRSWVMISSFHRAESVRTKPLTRLALTGRTLGFLGRWLCLTLALSGDSHQHFALAGCGLLRLPALGRLRGASLADVAQALAQRVHQVDDIAGVTRLHGGADRLALALLVQEFDQSVLVPVLELLGLEVGRLG